MKNSKAKGIHYLIDLYGCDEGQINNSEELKDILRLSLKDTEAVVFERVFLSFFSEKEFNWIFVLSASHISIHTWPGRTILHLTFLHVLARKKQKKS